MQHGRISLGYGRIYLTSRGFDATVRPWSSGEQRIEQAGIPLTATGSMDVPARLRRTLSRLGSALDQLEAAAARRAQAEAARGNLEDELAVMQDDRARLALELDAALARGRGFAIATADVARRLERVEATVKAVLDGVERDLPTDAT